MTEKRRTAKSKEGGFSTGNLKRQTLKKSYFKPLTFQKGEGSLLLYKYMIQYMYQLRLNLNKNFQDKETE